MTEFQPSNRGRGDLILPKHLKTAMFIIYYIYYTIDYHNILLLLLLSSSHPLYPKFHKIVFSTTYDILWFYSNYYVCWLVFLFKEFPRRREEGRVKIRQWLRWEQNRDFPTTPSFTPVALSLSHNFIFFILIFSHLCLYPKTSSLSSVFFSPQLHH